MKFPVGLRIAQRSGNRYGQLMNINCVIYSTEIHFNYCCWSLHFRKTIGGSHLNSIIQFLHVLTTSSPCILQFIVWELTIEKPYNANNEHQTVNSTNNSMAKGSIQFHHWNAFEWESNGNIAMLKTFSILLCYRYYLNSGWFPLLPPFYRGYIFRMHTCWMFEKRSSMDIHWDGNLYILTSIPMIWWCSLSTPNAKNKLGILY